MPAGDFYFAINATFRYLFERFGEEALVEYWRAMGKDYFAPLSQRFREGGLGEVEGYWRDFFKAEPGGEVEVRQEENRVEIEVHKCPAIGWLRASEREVAPCYCLHCHHVNHAIAEDSGLTFTLEGGGGSCHQTFQQHAEIEP